MKLLSHTEFILHATTIHCKLYDYSLIQFPVTRSQRISVIDPEFGVFETNVNRHLAGAGHKKRGAIKSADTRRMSTADFIYRANKIHKNFYDYSKVVYKSMTIKICIVDPEYGEFFQSPAGHLDGQGHPQRGNKKAADKRKMGLSKFITQSRSKHGDLYDYTKVNYVNCDTKVCIVDPEYGEFWQSPWQHLKSHGCPARTKNKKWAIHQDHIIPLSILRQGKVVNKWYENRPLFKFLNSGINLVSVTAKFNIDKSDFITVNGKKIAASTIRNNYDIIAHLIKTLLNIDPTLIIQEDQSYIKEYFNLT